MSNPNRNKVGGYLLFPVKAHRHSLAIILPRSHDMLPLNSRPYKVSVFGLLLSVSAYPFCNPHLALFLFTLSSARFSISGILAFAFRLADSCLCFALPFFGSVLYVCWHLEPQIVQHVQIVNTCTRIFTYALNDTMRERLLMCHIVNPALVLRI